MTTATLIPAREIAYARDLARAFAGALLFSLPLLMTMEMWKFGQELSPMRLSIFLVLGIVFLGFLAHFAGFTARRGVVHAVRETFAALAIGFIVAGFLMALLAILDGEAPFRHGVGQVTLQAVTAAIGALVARRQLGKDSNEDKASYPGELFLMVAGALFLSVNIAPTEETALMAYRVDPWRAVGLVVVSLGVMHAIVYAAGFARQEEAGQPVTSFFHFTLAGYGLVMLTALLVLWLFNQTDGLGAHEIIDAVVVLSFPGAIGAAAARSLV